MTATYSPALAAPRRLTAPGEAVVYERTRERVTVGPALGWERGPARDAAVGAPALPAPPRAPHKALAPGPQPILRTMTPAWQHRAGAPLPTSAVLQMRAATRQLWR